MNAEQLAILGDAMDALDDELIAAEKSGHVSAQIATLRERARVWRDYGRLLEAAGSDSHGAELAALRDEANAHQLESDPR